MSVFDVGSRLVGRIACVSVCGADTYIIPALASALDGFAEAINCNYHFAARRLIMTFLLKEETEAEDFAQALKVFTEAVREAER